MWDTLYTSNTKNCQSQCCQAVCTLQFKGCSRFLITVLFVKITIFNKYYSKITRFNPICSFPNKRTDINPKDKGSNSVLTEAESDSGIINSVCKMEIVKITVVRLTPGIKSMQDPV